MTPHARKYREKESHPFPVWNGIFEHVRRIGCAIWVFLWCLDKVTHEREGVGIVLGGSPVKILRIAADLGMGEHTVRRHCDLLEKGKCIRRRRTPYGFVIEVFNSHKFGIWHASERAQRRTISRSNLADLTGKNGRNKEDAAVNAAVDAAKRRSAVWTYLGIDGSGFPPPVREVCERLYETKNGQTSMELIGACMDEIEALGERIPRRLAKRAAHLRTTTKFATRGAIPRMKAEPWAK